MPEGETKTSERWEVLVDVNNSNGKNKCAANELQNSHF